MSVRGRFLWLDLLAEDPGAALRSHPVVGARREAELRADEGLSRAIRFAAGERIAVATGARSAPLAVAEVAS